MPTSPQDERRKLPTRRAVLRGLAPAAIAVATPVVADGVEDKVSKLEAMYHFSPNGRERCGNCTFLIGLGACQIVFGGISLNGWCRFYRPH